MSRAHGAEPSGALSPDTPRAYGYRFVVLGVFALLNAVVQLDWIAFAAITGDASRFYGVSELAIGLLSLVFMAVFVVLSIPASWVIDTWGVRVGVGIGAALTGVFALTRGAWGASYGAVLVSQIGLAAGQPFVMNAITKVGARWFPVHERATAAAVPSLAQFLGIIVGLAATPFLYRAVGLVRTLELYAVASAAAAVLFLVFAREAPPTPPSRVDQAPRFAFGAGLRHLVRQRDVWLLLVLFFIGLGMFNAISTWIEEILAPRGFGPERAGVAGAVMVVGGIFGAALLPVLSDRLRRRKPFLVLAVAGMIPGLVGLTFATSYPWLLAASFVFGFFLMSAYPVGFQYGAEIGYPAPESTIQGLIVMAGQVSGMLFIVGMDLLRSGPGRPMTGSMVAYLVLTVITVGLTVGLRESPLIRAEADTSP